MRTARAGYIERRYVSCRDDQAGTHNNTIKTGDQCWRSDNATLSMSGQGGEMVFETGKGWHLRNDNGSRIEKTTCTGNGDGDGDAECWKLIGTDGTQYFFGLNTLPGQVPATDAVRRRTGHNSHVAQRQGLRRR
ncbi:hypothetical protein F4553_001925 [Allocatelliglobosispora scoriae]|uniref:Uncharacterized protein n=1 Tax=Allocatelliglobosispora scoriae TaxID=643052 RepID=A0A841BMQ5_9ACTN|nr:hypothetical protein [Allocatelliglobosispora scoriae]MBB5868546.1 hypothetical protein [Allocatelliglobosispora scoriae]